MKYALDQVIGSMEKLNNGLKDDEKEHHFERALSSIYFLQKCLDFEKGGEIADNLFQTYEFARQMIIGSIKNMDETGPKRALALLAEIREAWAQMGEQLSNEK